MMGEKDYTSHSRGLPHMPPNGLKYLNTYSLSEANEMLTSDKWTRALFVRDPKERSLSAYLTWKPVQLYKSMTNATIEDAKLGKVNETIAKTRGGPGVGLVKCCKVMSDGDYNWEVMCLNHVKTFEGFLDLNEDGQIPIPLDANGRKQWSPGSLRKSPSCQDKHWTPVSLWRMESKFYPYLNFIGHLEVRDIARKISF